MYSFKVVKRVDGKYEAKDESSKITTVGDTHQQAVTLLIRLLKASNLHPPIALNGQK